MNCPHCGKSINVGALLGARRSIAKSSAARKNGRKGGWPKGKKRASVTEPTKLTDRRPRKKSMKSKTAKPGDRRRSRASAGSADAGLEQLLDHCEAAMEAAAAYCPDDLAISLRNRARRCRSERRDVRNDFVRGFVCAVTAHWHQHGDPVTTRDLLRGAGNPDRIANDADPIDVDALREAGFLPKPDEDGPMIQSPNAQAHP